jgi:hypothetical protein
MKNMKKVIKAQFIVLLIGTIFAWGNFAWELINWLNSRNCATGCAAPSTNPFLTPCFYGALFFTAAFILSVVLFRGTKKEP